MKKILVPVDGSKTSIHTFDYVKHFAKIYDSEIHLMNVEEKTASGFKAGENVISESLAYFEGEELNIKTRVELGDVAKNILRISEEENFDLVVIGTHGMDYSRIFNLGSTASKVIHHSKVPVLLIREKYEKTFDRMKILVPFDGSKISAKAFNYAKQLGCNPIDHITILNVQEKYYLSRMDMAYTRIEAMSPETLEMANIELGHKIVESAKEDFKDCKAMVDTRVELGNITGHIIDIAEEEDFNLIVMSTHGLSATRRFIIGSVTNKVATHSKVPILIVEQG